MSGEDGAFAWFVGSRMVWRMQGRSWRLVRCSLHDGTTASTSSATSRSITSLITRFGGWMRIGAGLTSTGGFANVLARIPAGNEAGGVAKGGGGFGVFAEYWRESSVGGVLLHHGGVGRLGLGVTSMSWRWSLTSRLWDWFWWRSTTHARVSNLNPTSGSSSRVVLTSSGSQVLNIWRSRGQVLNIWRSGCQVL